MSGEVETCGSDLIISQNAGNCGSSGDYPKDCTLVDLKDDFLLRKLVKHSKSVGSTHFSSAASSIENRRNFIRQTSYPVASESLDKIEACDPRFSNGTKSKLLLLNDKLAGFERQMELQAKQRRKLEESRLYNINESLDKLQNAITLETKRRMETIKALNGIFESLIASVQTKVESLFMPKLDQLESVVQSLSDRIDNIQSNVGENESRFINIIESNCITLERNLSNVQKSFESEKIARQEREQHITKKLSEIEFETDLAIKEETDKMNATYQGLKNDTNELRRYIHDSTTELKSTIMDEIANLNNSLILESRAREDADDDIVQALHNYAKILADTHGIAIS
ncbi:hypothetical protein BEWA_004600 [Theileria equi strain WA]|uniref:SF-assemblin n=1 Tax=Theileria equi strain WA TaxID=1537102 RepID=L0AZM9_THEEQ|nr:hypothetical protein BEWA_004600 [Theileria equi strain WA]AFZ81052.1 hypothetical protein BEWA_004600 [Theileria equi strain WA]|eukprot:XP_004830718.1 hypothetical protein BEWA_004600 [Theileria equi strain WA]